MQDALVQVKVDNELKTNASSIYNTLGLDLPTAIRIFLRASIASYAAFIELYLPSSVSSP